MAWSDFFRIVGAGAVNPAGDKVLSAALSWHNEAKAREAIDQLFRHTMLDAQGNIPADRRRQEAAGLSLVATQLNVTGLVDHPVYSVEVINLALPGDDPSRVRYFGYDSGTFRLWPEKPVRNALIAPSIWPPTYKAASYFDKPRELPPIPLDSSWLLRSRYGAAKMLNETLTPAEAFRMHRFPMDLRMLVEHVTELLHQHAGQDQFQIPPELQQFTEGNLSIWITPLMSGMSELSATYYVIVRHNKIIRRYPKGIVVFHYHPGFGLSRV